YPMDQIPDEKYKLPSFVWLDYIRPRDKDDIFNWIGKHENEKLKKIERTPPASPRDMHIERQKNKK
ncbi:MAG: hypothetical protein LUB83_02140, partial [Prevotellaceae bacterium]|nr:hypothetical protein [Prevotellaceae bacterium]